MKVNLSKFFLSLSAIVLLAVVAVPVMAASTDFLDKAKRYYNKECTKKKNPGLEKSFFCYLFDKVGELDKQLTALTSRVSDLEANEAEQKGALKVFDADGNELGLFTWETGRIFSEALGKFVRIDVEAGHVIATGNPTLWFETADCSGPPFITADGAKDSAKLAWKSIFTDKYYVVDETVPPRTATARGQLTQRGESIECSDNDITFENVRTPKEVTLPFPDPFSVPLKFLVTFE